MDSNSSPTASPPGRCAGCSSSGPDEPGPVVASGCEPCAGQPCTRGGPVAHDRASGVPADAGSAGRVDSAGAGSGSAGRGRTRGADSGSARHVYTCGADSGSARHVYTRRPEPSCTRRERHPDPVARRVCRGESDRATGTAAQPGRPADGAEPGAIQRPR
jgi:hypothetical protein